MGCHLDLTSLLKRDVSRGAIVWKHTARVQDCSGTETVFARNSKMTLQLNVAENRRVSSFRIDDILASPQTNRSETSSRATRGSFDTLPPSLSFSVDQILASPTSQHKNEIRCYGKKLKSIFLPLLGFLYMLKKGVKVLIWLS